MADFDVEIVPSARLTFPAWADEPDGEDPSRLNPRRHVPHRYARVRVEPLEVVTIEFRAIVGGVAAPADGALGGRLVAWTISEHPIGSPIPIITTPIGGKSSRASAVFRGIYPGHWTIVARRPQGGHVVLPFDVEATP